MSEQSKKIIDEAGKLLVKYKATIAVAESVTAGNVQAPFSIADNETSFFRDGISVNKISQKCRL